MLKISSHPTKFVIAIPEAGGMKIAPFARHPLAHDSRFQEARRGN